MHAQSSRIKLRNGPIGSLCLQPLWQLHPAGIHSHTQLLIPDHLSTAAASLLTEVRPQASAHVFTRAQTSVHRTPPSMSYRSPTVAPVRPRLPAGIRRRRRVRHQVPPVLQRRLLESSGLLTALTPRRFHPPTSTFSRGRKFECFPKKSVTIKTET